MVLHSNFLSKIYIFPQNTVYISSFHSIFQTNITFFLKDESILEVETFRFLSVVFMTASSQFFM